MGICADECSGGTTGWTLLGQSCFKLIPGLYNLNEAIDKCVVHGAHLVYIGSSEENDFIKNLT